MNELTSTGLIQSAMAASFALGMLIGIAGMALWQEWKQ